MVLCVRGKFTMPVLFERVHRCVLPSSLHMHNMRAEISALELWYQIVLWCSGAQVLWCSGALGLWCYSALVLWCWCKFPSHGVSSWR